MSSNNKIEKYNFAVLTSDSPRHIYFLQQLEKVVSPTLVIVEQKPKLNKTTHNAEIEMFGNLSHSGNITQISYGEINSNTTIDKIKKSEIDFCLVFGTSILKNELIDTVKSDCINVHTGLTQYYRGVDSCKWAIYNNELDKIGVTIHKINSGIDTGEVLLQKTIEISPGDTHDTLFIKLCKIGSDLLSQNLLKIVAGKVQPKPLYRKGKLYKLRDMNDNIDNFLQNNTKKLITKYLSEKENEK